MFGTVLGLIACRNGLRVSGGAAGVGKATTDTVVQTIVTVIFLDLGFTASFTRLAGRDVGLSSDHLNRSGT